jgi:hypothetical protein
VSELIGPYIPPIVLDADFMRPSLVDAMIREYEDILESVSDERGLQVVSHVLERLYELRKELA